MLMQGFYPLTEEEKPVVEIQTDASSEGWGAVCSACNTGGRSKKEEDLHINAIELLAIEFALQSFELEVTNKHVKLSCDNSCAVPYIRNMGGSHSLLCDSIAHRIWV